MLDTNKILEVQEIIKANSFEGSTAKGTIYEMGEGDTAQAARNIVKSLQKQGEGEECTCKFEAQYRNCDKENCARFINDV